MLITIVCDTIHTLSLRFHNGITHFGAYRDNQELLYHRAIRQLFVKFNYLLKRIV